MDGGPPANTHRVPLRRHPLRFRIARLGRKKESASLDGVWRAEEDPFHSHLRPADFMEGSTLDVNKFNSPKISN